MEINFAIVKTTQDLENYALAKLINRNGWDGLKVCVANLRKMGLMTL